MIIAERRRHFLFRRVSDNGILGQRQHRILLRYVDHLPEPVLLGLPQRGERPDCRIKRSGKITDDRPHAHRRSVRITVHRPQTAGSLTGIVVRRLGRIRAGTAVAADRGVDELRDFPASGRHSRAPACPSCQVGKFSTRISARRTSFLNRALPPGDLRLSVIPSLLRLNCVKKALSCSPSSPTKGGKSAHSPAHLGARP